MIGQEGKIDVNELDNHLQLKNSQTKRFAAIRNFFTRPKKYALCIGINYTGTDSQLNGCIEDVKRISEYLKSQGYEIKTLLETEATASNILKAMIDFSRKAISGDTLFFHYSGHGGQLLDANKEEKTGMDSTLVPYDFQTVGQIPDDYIYKYMIRPICKGVKLFGIIDACHSGSSFDLRYQINDQSTVIKEPDATSWTYNPALIKPFLLFSENKAYPKTLCEVYMLSGCQDEQTSADAFINGRYTGALTDCFLKTIKQFDKKLMKWKHLLYNTRGFLRQSNFDQIPQLSSGQSPDLEGIVWF